MRRVLVPPMVLAIVLLTAGMPPAQPQTGSPWPMFRHNANHTGRSDEHEGPPLCMLSWSYYTGEEIYSSSPCVGSDGRAHIATYSGTFWAFDSAGGLAWSYRIGAALDSSPAIADGGNVYVGAVDNRIYAFDSAGKIAWSYQTGGGVRSSPAIAADGRVYIGSDDNALYCLDSSGTRLWTYYANENIGSTPAVGIGNSVCVGSLDGRLYAIDSAGGLVWSYHMVGYILSSPSIVPGRVYVGNNHSNIWALNWSGVLLWSYQTGERVQSSPAVGTDARVYIGSNDNHLYVLESTGALAWSYRTAGHVESSPAIGSGTAVYFGSLDNRLYAIGSRGALRWSYDTGGEVRSSPAITGDGRVLVGSDDARRVYCIEAAPTPTGTPAPAPTSTPAPPPGYIHPSLAPGRVPPGGTAGLSWRCEFTPWNYGGQPVDVYLAAIRDPKVAGAASSVEEALAGGEVWIFEKGMKTSYRYAGTVKAPCWRDVVFPPAPLLGTLDLAVPADPSFHGNWVFATTFVRKGPPGGFVRDDGRPVENSNIATVAP
ncbi:MAG: PQQ-binding-like beta-propeller repeat protein [bacterium]|nr:PQQ-binding-like beta-propeller repeat protein [bacterium]